MQASPTAGDGAGEHTRARLPRWVFAAAPCLWIVQCVAFHGVRKDDAFITYRYAQNLATGHGLVFNPGEHVMGSTSPGHVLLSAIVYLVAGKELLPTVMACLGCLGWTAQALAAALILRRALVPAAAWMIGLAVAVGAARSEQFVSLETNFVAALLSWALLCAIERRWSPAAALAALAVLFRPDMYLAAGLLGAVCLWQLRRNALRPALVFIAIIAPWYLFAWRYFGSVLPQSAIAKYQRTSALEYAVFEFVQPPLTVLPFPKNIWIALLGWTLACVGGLYLVRKDRRLWVLPAYLIMHCSAYLYLRPFMHSWHLYPTYLVFALLVLSAVAASAELAPRARRYAGSVGLLTIALMTLAYAQRNLQFAAEHEDDYWFGARDRAYRDIAQYLVRHAQPTDVVASVEVGTLAYYSNLPMYDWGALITPHPVLRPVQPRLRWAVIDKLFVDRFAEGILPIKQFRTQEFFANVYSFDLMAAAMQQLMAQQLADGVTSPSATARPAFEHELALLADGLERSGQRIDVFLRTHARRP